MNERAEIEHNPKVLWGAAAGDVNSRQEDRDAAAEAIAAAGEFFDPEADHDEEPAAPAEEK